jgi:membrane dipeptidase
MATNDPDPEALSLHRRAVVADTHNDLMCSVVLRPVEQWAAYFRAELGVPADRRGAAA